MATPAAPLLKPLVVNSSEGPTLSVVGETIRVLADTAATSGAAFVFENITPPGGGPPLHRHARDDEHFFVFEGRVKFSVNGAETTVGPGAYIFAPRGSIHTFRNVGDTPSRMFLVVSPGELEAPFRECDRLERAGQLSKEAVGPTFGRHGVEVLGPPLGP